MLDYAILNKSIISRTGPSGNEENQYDLLSMNITTDFQNIQPQDVVIVNEYYVARPDLISLAVYGNDKFADYICKYNGISNPFEMNENDVIIIPDISGIQDKTTRVAASELITDSSSQTIIEKKNKYQKEKDEKRSPAQQIVGESNYKIDKSLGIIFY
jgi:hypothetical protein